MTTVSSRVRSRLAIIAVIVFSLLAAIVVRLYSLQVLAGDTFASRANRNAVRFVVDEAPRGRILDSQGRVLVTNRTQLVIQVRRQNLPSGEDGEAVKAELASLLDISLEQLENRLATVRIGPLDPVIVARDITTDQLLYVREHARSMEGVEATAISVRSYPKGSLASHVLGYLTEINPDELQDRPGYLPGNRIGRTGIEREFESDLRGRPGRRKLEVDASGTVLRTIGRMDPIPGDDVQLTIDSRIQRVAEEALIRGAELARSSTFKETGQRFRAPAGAVVVLDPRTGAVRAMASYPDFDLHDFIGGISVRDYGKLTDPKSNQPLINRAMEAAYPPGSTFKPIVVAAALTEGDADERSYLPCKTEFEFGDRIFRNWRPRNAMITLRNALMESCDTPFYALAKKWWLREAASEARGVPPREIIQEYSRKFGLASETGIELPGFEADGRIPDRRWRLDYWEANRNFYCSTARKTGSALYRDLCESGYRWRGGDTVNLSIGQGDILVSPLQLARTYAAIANGGTLVTPHLVEGVKGTDGKTEELPIPDPDGSVDIPTSVLNYIKSALVATSTQGTAAYPMRGWPHATLPVASKTGSAEIAGKQPFSWFAAFAPANNPKYVVISVMEEAGSGSGVSGPIVRRVLDQALQLDPLPFGLGGFSD